MKKIINWFDLVNDWVGFLIGPLTLLMVILTCTVVFARYLLDLGAVQVQESVLYLHSVVFMLGAGYTLKQGGHVRVDILYQGFSPRGQAIVNLLGSVFFLFPLSGFLLWSSYDYVHFSWQLKEGSAEPGGLPYIYLLKSLMPIMAVLLLLQGTAEVLRSITTLKSGKYGDYPGD